MKATIANPGWLFFCCLILMGSAGCNTTQIVSERSFEEKVERLRVGLTSRSDVETLLGQADVVERNRLVYYFADMEFSIGRRRYTPPSGVLPVSAGAFPSNTRGVITTGFNNAGKLRLLAVERYFEEPFINDYSYVIKDSAKEPFDAIVRIATEQGFKTVDLNKEDGTVTLRNDQSKAQINIKLDGQTLNLTSKNPHSRVSTEYRLHSRRENHLTAALASADWVQ